MADASHNHDDGSQARKKILRVTIILTLITLAEFAVAFSLGPGMARLSIFMVMTIVKAFYIVSSFMHLGDEVKKLAMAILLPFLFIVWLLIALGKDGDSYGSSANRAGNYTYKKIESTHGHGGGHDAPAHTPAKAGESHGH